MVFLDPAFSLGVWQWSIQISYSKEAQSRFCVGVSEFTNSKKVFHSSDEDRDFCSLCFWKNIVGTRLSALHGVRDSFDIPEKETGVPNNSIVTIEADVDGGTLCFFVNRRKIPRAVSSYFRTPLRFAIRTQGNPSFTSLSLRRIRRASPSPVVCQFYEDKKSALPDRMVKGVDFTFSETQVLVRLNDPYLLDIKSEEILRSLPGYDVKEVKIVCKENDQLLREYAFAIITFASPAEQRRALVQRAFVLNGRTMHFTPVRVRCGAVRVRSRAEREREWAEREEWKLRRKEKDNN